MAQRYRSSTGWAKAKVRLIGPPAVRVGTALKRAFAHPTHSALDLGLDIAIKGTRKRK
jgi:hypothetical protein